jgi:hypothetical protein
VGKHFLALIMGTGSMMYVIGNHILCGRVEDGYQQVSVMKLHMTPEVSLKMQRHNFWPVMV